MTGLNFDPRPLLVLDLDETLWTSSDADGTGLILRPHLTEFFRVVAPLFQIGIWTAASVGWATTGLAAVYAETGQDLVRTARFIWFRDRCGSRYDEATQQREVVKPLHKVWRGGRFRKEQTLAVDDLAGNFRCAYGNLIAVRPFAGDANDTELRVLAGYLQRLHPEPDYRRIEKRGWRHQKGGKL